ncbi:Uncharacterised protein [Mycobacteroides abscessus subsp. massiliense]|nr:Uncharacterised protein [Mycobacteroides abscessus subsp. massiliense]
MVGDFKADDDTAAVLLFADKLCLRMVGQTGVVHGLDLWLLFQPLRDFQRIVVLFFHTQRQGFHAAQQLPCVKRRHRQTARVAIHGNLRHQFFRTGQHAAHHAAVTVNGFGCGRHGNIRTVFQRLRTGWRQEAVVHHQKRADTVCQFGQRFQVGNFAQRVGRGFQEKQFGIGLDCRFPFIYINRRYMADLDAELSYDIIDKTDSRTKQTAAGNNMITGF